MKNYQQILLFLNKQSLILRNKTWILVLAGLGILFDIFIFKTTSDIVILCLMPLWVLSVWLHKLTASISINGGLFFLLLCPLLLILSQESMAEKSAVWAYLFLTVGTIQIFIEYLSEKDPRN